MRLEFDSYVLIPKREIFPLSKRHRDRPDQLVVNKFPACETKRGEVALTLSNSAIVNTTRTNERLPSTAQLTKESSQSTSSASNSCMSCKQSEHRH
jgi:hypothetical protein